MDIGTFLTTNQPPWWTALVTLVVGALVGIAVTNYNARQTQSRENRFRFHREVIAVGTKLVNTVILARDQVELLRAAAVPAGAQVDPALAAAEVRLAELVRQARVLQDELKFLAGRPTNNQALALIAVVDEQRTDPRPDWGTRFWEQVDSFVNAVRAELEMPALVGRRQRV